MGTWSTKSVLACSAAVMCVAVASPAMAQQRTFDVPAQSAAKAIPEFARQAGIQIIAAGSKLRGKRTNAVKGQMDVRAALNTLLAGTGLRIATDNGSTIALTEGNGDTVAESSPSLEPDGGEEIVVTGTNIRGKGPIGSRVETVTSRDIERSGYGRFEDILRNIPQNFRGIGEDATQQGVINLNRGAEIQLRGLGQGTTLTLVNGFRQSPGGQRGGFVDVSTIPTSAIDRVEILADGASAIYGSDAVGGVVNIILKKDFQGFETSARASSSDGDAREIQVSQLAGFNWSSGNILAGYQYIDRNSLGAADRSYRRANGDNRRFGGTDLRTFASNPGTILNLANLQPAYAIPSGQDGRSLTPSRLIPGAANYTDNVTGIDILPAEEMHSGFIHARQDMGSHIELFSDAYYSYREVKFTPIRATSLFIVPSTNAFFVPPTPGATSLVMAYDFTEELGYPTNFATTEHWSVAGGLRANLGSSWELTLSSSYSAERTEFSAVNGINATALAAALRDSNPATALNVFGDGLNNNPTTLNSLRQPSYEKIDTSALWAGAIARGPLFGLPAGDLALAVGTDDRREAVHQVNPFTSANRRADRDVVAAFGELALPVFGAANRRPGFDTLAFSLAGRFERYSDFGSTFNWKAGGSWKPVGFATLRGTWGTSFRAPPFYLQSAEFSAPFGSATIVQDPRSPTRLSNVLLIGGNNTELDEETAETWTVGLDFSFGEQRSLTFGAAYFDIDYRGKITSPNSTILLLQEEIYAPAITRNPTPAQVAAVCSLPRFIGTCTGPFAAILDVRTLNLAKSRTRGIDFYLNYSRSFGNWTAGANVSGTRLLGQDTAITATAPEIDITNTLNNPARLRLRGSATIGRKDWTVAATVNHTNAYRVSTAANSARIDAWTTLDLSAQVQLTKLGPAFAGTRLTAAVTNLTNEAPPFVNVLAGYDPNNANIYGRRLSLQITHQW